MSTAQELRERLVGAWELVSYHCDPVEEGDERIYPMSDKAQGIIMYTPDGYMSAQLMTPGVPKFRDGDLSGGSTEELVSVAKNYLAYSGPWVVEENNGKPLLKHSMTVSSFPNWLGNTQVRTVKLEGEYLTLGTEGPIVTLGTQRQPVLKWRRKPSNKA